MGDARMDSPRPLADYLRVNIPPGGASVAGTADIRQRMLVVDAYVSKGWHFPWPIIRFH